MNRALIRLTADRIERFPHLFDQTVMTIGADSGCIAWHVLRASGISADEARRIEGDSYGIHRRARQLLRLTAKQADILFGHPMWWTGAYGDAAIKNKTRKFGTRPERKIVDVAVEMLRALAC